MERWTIFNDQQLGGVRAEGPLVDGPTKVVPASEVERLREALQDTEADLIFADHEPRKRLARQMTIARGRIREALNGKESP